MDPVKSLVDKASDAAKEFFERAGVDMDLTFVPTPDPKLGDMSLPCFAAAKPMKKSPAKIAEELASYIHEKGTFKGQAKAVGPYLNLRLDRKALTKITLGAILEMKGRYGSGVVDSKKILIEHTSANPNGPFHVGRARNPIIGDTLARIMRHAGHNITTEYYVNDMGLQMAVLKWGMENIPETELDASERDKVDHKLVRYYQKANAMMESDPEVEKQIRSILKKYESHLEEKGHEELPEKINLKKLCREVLAGMTESLGELGVEVDSFYYESEVFASGRIKKVIRDVEALPEKGVDIKKQGNVISLDMAPYGIHGKNTVFVFTRDDGTTLYTTRDLAYHQDKFSRSDMLINILGEDHRHQAKVLETLLGLLGENREAIQPLFYAFVSLPDGKMSTRRGRIVFLDDLIDEAIHLASEEVRKRRDDLSEEEIMKIAKAVGPGAIRFNIIRVQPDKSITFKWEEALSFEGFSSPYLQYATSRASGILKKAGMDKISPGMKITGNLTGLTSPSEEELVWALASFPGVVAQCSESRKVHTLPSYLYSLSRAFSDFYRDNPVIGSELETERLLLVMAAKQVLSTGLGLLGIEALESM